MKFLIKSKIIYIITLFEHNGQKEIQKQSEICDV